jgi:hypothetical protein
LGGIEKPPIAPVNPPTPPVPSPSPAPPGRRWVVLGVLASVAALAAAILGVVIVSDDDASDQASPGSTADQSSEEPSIGSEHDTTGTPTDAEVEDLVAELSDYVEEQRGLEFEEPVQVDIEDDDAFHERLFADFDEDAEQTALSDPLFKAFGLLDPGEDLVETMRTALEGAVVGFYDPETDELVVRGAAITPAVRVTITHELTHALDDQHFDLDRQEYDDADDEIALGFSGLVEGSAVTVENAYTDTLTTDETEQYFDEQMSYGIPDVPLAILDLIGAPYQYGPGLIAALRADGGRERLDDAFAEPPRTSEQVLHPDAYLDAEPRLAVEHPAADGEVVWDGVLGELFTQVVLSQEVPDQAGAAAEGWGGDWATTWREGDRSCARAVVVGDTPDDSDELYAAWSAWADAVEVTASAEQPQAGGPVTIDACSAPTPAEGGPSAPPIG